jgi:D-aminopeptidase
MTTRRRFRDLGFTIGALPTGAHNAITDVDGVRVGHATIRSGEGRLAPGTGPVRTGVTAIVPHAGDLYRERVAAAIDILNGSGEVTGRTFVDEMGVLDAPIMLTNSFNVPRVADAVISETIAREPTLGIEARYVHPVVAECSDLKLSDIQGRHVGREHVAAAWSGATGGAVAEGCVGGGTGLVCYQFKSGIGTSSRVVEVGGTRYTVGVLAMPNHGVRRELRVDGVPIGELLPDNTPSWIQEGSVILVTATDAPLSSRQLRRIARRSQLGLARTGATARNGSGDMTIAFSTAQRLVLGETVHTTRELADQVIDPLFAATCEAAEEAVINALCAAETMTGRDGNTAYAIPPDRLSDLLVAHGRVRTHPYPETALEEVR